MIEHEYQFRVLYPDTDQMGTVHHSNYVSEVDAFETFKKGWFGENIHKMDRQKDDGRFTASSHELI